jgi:hypothetical protein
MHKSMMQISYVTTALAFAIAAAAPPALANEVCSCWRPHHHVASVWRRAHYGQAHWGHAHWAHRGWGPGIGFYALTGVANDHPLIYNHPYYYGGGPYGNCTGTHLVYDERGNVLGRQSVYIC